MIVQGREETWCSANWATADPWRWASCVVWNICWSFLRGFLEGKITQNQRWRWTQAWHNSCSRNSSSSLETRGGCIWFSTGNCNLWCQVAETYRKQETVVNFDTTSRRGGGEVSFPLFLFHICHIWYVRGSSFEIAFSVRWATWPARPSSQGTRTVGRRNTDGERRLIGSSGKLLLLQQINNYICSRLQVVENDDEACCPEKARSSGMGGRSPLGSPRPFHPRRSLLISGRVNWNFFFSTHFISICWLQGWLWRPSSGPDEQP